MNQVFGFVLVIERGDLEAKAVLLVESIRRLSALRECPIFVVQPRCGDLPSLGTLRLLAQNDVQFIYEDLNKNWKLHGLMNKVYAAAYVEPFAEQMVETLVFLDSDVLVVSPPNGLAMTGKDVVAIAPIAEWQIGKIGQLLDEPVTPYWKMIYEVCDVTDVPDWHVVSTIDRRQMFPYFNSGVVAVRPSRGFFRQWRENVVRLSQDIRALGLPPKSNEYFFLDQATMAGTLLKMLARDEIRVLDHRYNYPLHAHHRLPDGVRASRLDDISLVHYHGHFTNLYWMDDIEISDELASWLLDRLPFRPKLRMSRSAMVMLTSHLMSQFPFRKHHHRVISRLPGLSKTVPQPERTYGA